MSSYTNCQGTFSQSSQLAEPLRTDPGIKSEISVGKLIFASESKTEKHRQGMNGQTFSQNPCKRGKKPPPPHCMIIKYVHGQIIIMKDLLSTNL